MATVAHHGIASRHRTHQCSRPLVISDRGYSILRFERRRCAVSRADGPECVPYEGRPLTCPAQGSVYGTSLLAQLRSDDSGTPRPGMTAQGGATAVPAGAGASPDAAAVLPFLLRGQRRRPPTLLPPTSSDWPPARPPTSGCVPCPPTREPCRGNRGVSSPSWHLPPRKVARLRQVPLRKSKGGGKPAHAAARGSLLRVRPARGPAHRATSWLSTTGILASFVDPTAGVLEHSRGVLC
jgi:hypothetical protein